MVLIVLATGCDGKRVRSNPKRLMPVARGFFHPRILLRSQKNHGAPDLGGCRARAKNSLRDSEVRHFDGIIGSRELNGGVVFYGRQQPSIFPARLSQCGVAASLCHRSPHWGRVFEQAWPEIFSDGATERYWTGGNRRIGEDDWHCFAGRLLLGIDHASTSASLV
jgi:hypothetical protein